MLVMDEIMQLTKNVMTIPREFQHWIAVAGKRKLEQEKL